LYEVFTVSIQLVSPASGEIRTKQLCGYSLSEKFPFN